MKNRLSAFQMGIWVILLGLVVVSLVECNNLTYELGVGETLRIITLFLLGISYLAAIIISTQMMRRREAPRKLKIIRIIILSLLVLLQVFKLTIYVPQQPAHGNVFGLTDINILLSLAFMVIIEQLMDVYVWVADYLKRRQKRRDKEAAASERATMSRPRKVIPKDRSAIRPKGGQDANETDRNSV